MPDPSRKPLARVAAQSRRETMVMWPMRWPPAILQRADERAADTGKSRSQVLREVCIAGFISLETQDAMRLHSGKTA